MRKIHTCTNCLSLQTTYKWYLKYLRANWRVKLEDILDKQGVRRDIAASQNGAAAHKYSAVWGCAVSRIVPEASKDHSVFMCSFGCRYCYSFTRWDQLALHHSALRSVGEPVAWPMVQCVVLVDTTLKLRIPHVREWLPHGHTLPFMEDMCIRYVYLPDRSVVFECFRKEHFARKWYTYFKFM